jgi:hypothetical protein
MTISFMVTIVLGFIALAPQIGPATDMHSPTLCPKIVASLTPYMGDPAETESGERVEVRQCPFNSEKGTLQLVAWEAYKDQPSLVIDPELRGLKQLVMIQGVYVFEIVSASSSTIIGITFEKGQPREALRVSTKGKTVIKANEDSVVVDLDEGGGRISSYVLKGEYSRRGSLLKVEK